MPTVDMKATGVNIRKMCDSAGVSATEMARRAGVSKTAVYKWFNGDSIPTVDNLVVIATEFRVRIDDVIVVRRA